MDIKKLSAFALAVLISLSASEAVFAQGKTIRLATGVKEGNYHSVGEAISSSSKLKFKVINTSGSLDNLLMLHEGKADFALCQFGVLDQLVGLLSDLKLVMYLYVEPIHLVVRKGSGIASLSDLKGKRIDIGPDGSGSSASAINILKGMGIKPQEWMTSSRRSPGAALEELMSGNLDAMFVTTGVGSSLFAGLPASAGSKISILSFTEKELDLVSTPQTLRKFWFSDVYPWHTARTNMPAAFCCLVTRKSVSASTVQAVAQTVYDNWQAVGNQNQAWKYSTQVGIPQEFIYNDSTNGLFLFHEGAIKFHKARQKAGKVPSEADWGILANLGKSNNSEAAYSMGWKFMNEGNKKRALKWFSESARLGHADAQGMVEKIESGG